MDFNSSPFVAGSFRSNSSGFSSSSSSSSHDSDNEGTMTLKPSSIRVKIDDNNDEKVRLGSNDDSGSGFMSDEEEFETAPDNPIEAVLGEEIKVKEMGGSGNDGVNMDMDMESNLSARPFVGSSSTLMPGGFRPVAKLSNDEDEDEDNDDIVGGVKVARDSLDSTGEVNENPDSGFERKGVFVDKSLRELGDLLEVGGGGGSGLMIEGALVNEPKPAFSKDEEAVKEESIEVAGNEKSVALQETKEASRSEADAVGLEQETEKVVVVDGKKFTAGGDTVVDIEVSGSEKAVALQETKEASRSEADAVGLEQETEKAVVVDGKKFTAGGDTVVDNIQVDLLNSGAAVVGEVDEMEESEIKGMEIPVGESVALENGFDKINASAQKSSDAIATNITDESVQSSAVSDLKEDDISGEKSSESPVENTVTVDSAQAGGEAPVQESNPDEPFLSSDQKGDEGNMLQSNGVKEEVEEAGPVDGVTSISQSHTQDVRGVSEDVGKDLLEEENEIEGSDMDGEMEITFENSQADKQLLALERESGLGANSGAESSRDNSQRIDGQIVTDSDEDVDTDEEGEGKELFDSAALAALLKAATGADTGGGSFTITSQDGSRLFSVEGPAGLGSPLRSRRPAPPLGRPSLFPSNPPAASVPENNLSEEEKKKLEKIQQLRVKFLRLVQKLGHSSEDSLAAQVLYRLALAAGRQTNQSFSLDAAKRTASELESEQKGDLDFSLNILVLGKAGVGKSATINSILKEDKASIDAFESTTTAVKEIVGTVDGVKIRIFDTPPLKSSVMEQNSNRKILSSIKAFTKKCPADIVLYVDRLDTQTRDLNDLPLLRTITSSLGTSIWRSAIVTLTHAASAPPDGPTGSPLSYDVFVAQRSHVVQQSIGQAVGDLRLMNPSLMNPVSLVENHPSCRKNRDGEKVLPNGQAWRPQLLLLCYSMKILSEASSLSKPQDPFDHRKLFGFRVRSPPLPYLLSWLLQSRTHPKLATDQGIENGDSDIDLDDLSDSDQEDEVDEYDQLPPFKPLKKVQLAKLSKDQRKAYLEEYDYRVKLLQKKQWKEELKRMKEMKKRGKVTPDEFAYMGEDADQENAPAAVQVPLHDMVLPPSFDSDNPAYRYRFLEPTSQFVARPVLDTHGWDHDCGYDGVNLEHGLAIASQFPAAVAVQITKDKKEFNIHLDSSVAAKHGENGSTMAGFDIQNIGKQLAYIVRGESKFKSFKKNKTAAGISVTFLGENVATGVKLEDQITLGKRLVLVGSAGTVRSQGDAAYGANLEVRLREADFPIGQDQSSLGLSLVKWRGDLALGANLQSQFSIGRSSKIAVRAGLNNKRSGQITVRTSSSEQLQIALVGILPIVSAIYKTLRPGATDNYTIY